jgi:hypothetical protein
MSFSGFCALWCPPIRLRKGASVEARSGGPGEIVTKRRTCFAVLAGVTGEAFVLVFDCFQCWV